MERVALVLSGISVLVVEDDPLIALDITMTLKDAGATVIGPCNSVAQFRSLIGKADFTSAIQGAVLDVELKDETSLPIARWLRQNGIPFLFHTGMNPAMMDSLSEFDAPIISKPSLPRVLISAIAEQVLSGTS